jgi:hypothetical protein
VTEDIAGLHCWLVAVEQMKVGAANGACCNLNDRIARMLDLGIRYRINPDVAFSVPA